MIPYFFIFFICLFLTILDLNTNSKYLKNFLLFSFCIIFILFSGLRWEIGTDWDNYYNVYKNINNFSFGESGYELFYEFFIRYSTFVINNYTFILLLTATIIISLTAITLKKYSPFPVLSYLLLLSYSLNSSGFGYRQDIAIALCFFSTYFIINKNFLLFIILILTASLFHQSAIIFIPAYWISNFLWNRKSILILTFIIIFIYLLIIKISYIASLFSNTAAYKVSNYNDMTPEERMMEMGNPIITVIRGVINRLFLILPPVYILIKQKGNKLFLITFNLLFSGLIFYLLFSPLGFIFLRFTRYYDIFQILLIPLTIYHTKPKYKTLFILFYIFYAISKFTFALISDGQVYIPYQTIMNF